MPFHKAKLFEYTGRWQKLKGNGQCQITMAKGGIGNQSKACLKHVFKLRILGTKAAVGDEHTALLSQQTRLY